MAEIEYECGCVAELVDDGDGSGDWMIKTFCSKHLELAEAACKPSDDELDEGDEEDD